LVIILKTDTSKESLGLLIISKGKEVLIERAYFDAIDIDLSLGF